MEVTYLQHKQRVLQICTQLFSHFMIIVIKKLLHLCKIEPRDIFPVVAKIMPR